MAWLDFIKWLKPIVDYTAVFFINIFMIAAGWAIHKDYLAHPNPSMFKIYLYSTLFVAIMFVILF